MKRVILILLAPVLVSIFSWAVGFYWLWPSFEKWALQKIKTETESTQIFKIQAKNLAFSPFKLNIALEKVEVIFLDDTRKTLPQMDIEQIKIRLDFFKLISGQFHVSALILKNIHTHLNLDPLLRTQGPVKELPLEILFKYLKLIPVDRFLIRDLNLSADSTDLELNFSIQNADLNLLNDIQKINLISKSIPIQKIQFKGMDLSDIQLQAHLVLYPNELKVLQMHLDSSPIFIQVFGRLNDFKNIHRSLDAELTVDFNAILDRWPKKLGTLELPKMQGEALAGLKLNFKKNKLVIQDLDISGQRLIYGKYNVGDFEAKASLQNKDLHFSKFLVKNPAGNIEFKKFHLSLEDDWIFSTQIQTINLDLQKTYQSLGLSSVPVFAQLSADLLCQGNVQKNFLFQCSDSKVTATNISIKSSNTEILAVDQLQAEGSFTVDQNQVSWKAKLFSGSSKGASQGLVNYKTGFNIDYQSDHLLLDSIKNLSNLKMKGVAILQGSVEGDSHSAIFDMNLNLKNFNFERYFLGDLQTEVSYRSGDLFLRKVQARLPANSDYYGGLKINFPTKSLEGSLRSEKMSLTDIRMIMSEIYLFPFDVAGSGAFKLDFSGPMDFFKLNYNLTSAFQRVQIRNEFFDQMYFDVRANAGNLKTDKVSLIKNQSQLQIDGTLSSDRNWDLIFSGKNWRLEDFSFISTTGSVLYGVLKAEGTIKGPFLSPIFQGQFKVEDTILESQSVEDSSFSIQTSAQQLFLQMSIMGETMKGFIRWPFQLPNPLEIKMKFLNWNFIQLLSAYMGRSFYSEYNSNFSGEINVASDVGDPWGLNGQIKLLDFYIQRADSYLKNSKSMFVNFQNGVGKIEDFLLSGQGQKLELFSDQFSKDNMNINLAAKINLRLFHVLMPFLDDINGPLEVSAQFSGPYTKPQILGNATIAEGFVKVKGLVHAFEKIKSDIVFSQSKILINSLGANFANGQLKGDGQITIAGVRNLPTAIRFSGRQLKLNIPDKIATQGSADLLFSGNWFPFVLSGTYYVDSGLATKELSSDGSGANVRINSYLAQLLKEKAAEPLIFDIQVVAEQGIDVKNSLIDGKVLGALQVKGSPANPGLLGKIQFVKNSQIFFKDTPFDVQTGTVRFVNVNEITNPELYIAAQSRVGEYDVNLLIQGPAQPSPQILLSSLPPLSDQDLVSLLALGVTSSKLDQDVQSREQAEQTGYLIGSAIFSQQNPLNKTIKDRLGVSLQFSSSFDSTKNISVPKVTLSRKLSSKVNASASRVLGEQSSFEFKLQYAINNNVSAIGIYETREAQEGSSIENSNKEVESILGLDLEFKTEFK